MIVFDGVLDINIVHQFCVPQGADRPGGYFHCVVGEGWRNLKQIMLYDESTTEYVENTDVEGVFRTKINIVDGALHQLFDVLFADFSIRMVVPNDSFDEKR